MGKKGSWYYALSCVLRPEPNEKNNNKKTRKSQRLFSKQKSRDLDSPGEAEKEVVYPAPPTLKPGVQLFGPEIEEARDGFCVPEADKKDIVAAEAADVVAAEAAADVVQICNAARPIVKTKEEVATLKIQSVFRGYMARRSFRAVKGLMRLERLVLGQSVKRQATTTLNYMQTMARVQRQVGARRSRMSEENQALQRQLQHRHDLENSKTNVEDWDDSTKSKEQIQADRQKQQEAAIKRERTLAYAYTHQQTWRNSLKQGTQAFMDQHSPQWGWNWLEKWMAARPWENKTIEEELSSEPPSAKSVTRLARKARRDLNLDLVKSVSSPKKKTRTPRRVSVSSSPSTTPKSVSVGRVKIPKSSRRSVRSADDSDDSRSTQSVRSELQRRHSGALSSSRDDESQASLSTPRSFMSRTSSAKSKSRSSMDNSEKDSVGSAKKRFSSAGSPSGQRRHSEPLKTGEIH